ncbi:MAG: orotate phosphoribosyltransferase [Candidatus Marinimicrobia bacterium]|nr:orotate phosphoribosyltransferase [Candidatus Neomarinimicrobiota bacterium]MBL7059788.1 orotate phosphoribosyltransferase [Candidatus Neomarinimicrobiota bacterium]
MNNQELLNIFRSTGALLDGHFILTSGRRSPTYFQCAKVLQHPKYLTLFSQMIVDHFADEKIDVVISPAVGGIVIGTEVGRLLGARSIFAERKNGEMTLRRGFEIKVGEKVLVVEDVITTGGSMLEVIHLVQRQEATVVGAGVVVDRSNGTVTLHENQFAVLQQKAVSYPSDKIPEDLAAIPATKPGSRGLK